MGLFDAITGNVNTGPIRRAGAIQGAAIPTATAQAVGGLQGQQTTLTDAEKAALAATQGGTTAGTGYLNQALGLYQPLASKANEAFNLYNQALSGGPDAARAFQDFWQSTGAQAELDKGITGLERTANERGMLSSGNLSQDLTDYITNAVRGGYQGWLGDLWQQGGMAPSVAGSEAGLYGGLADLASRGGTQAANIFGEFAPEIGGTQSAIGATQAGGTMAGAQNKAQTLANIFNAQQQGGQNALNFWGNLLTGGMGLAGRIYGSKPTATA